MEDYIRVFRTTKPYRAVIETHPEIPDRCQVVLKISRDIPPYISLGIGDVVHALRAALDQFACAAVELNGGDVIDQTAFPIWRADRLPSTQEYKSLVMGKVKGAARTFQEGLLCLEPYFGGKHEVLRVVDYLDITDKHRLLITALASYDSLTVDLSAMVPESFGAKLPSLRLVPDQSHFPLKHNDSLFEAPSDVMQKSNPKATIAIAFGEPRPLRGEPIVPTLSDIAETVAGIIKTLRVLL